MKVKDCMLTWVIENNCCFPEYQQSGGSSGHLGERFLKDKGLKD
jgi:hypothetical protein